MYPFPTQLPKSMGGDMYSLPTDLPSRSNDFVAIEIKGDEARPSRLTTE